MGFEEKNIRILSISSLFKHFLNFFNFYLISVKFKLQNKEKVLKQVLKTFKERKNPIRIEE